MAFLVLFSTYKELNNYTDEKGPRFLIDQLHVDFEDTQQQGARAAALLLTQFDSEIPHSVPNTEEVNSIWRS